MRRRGPIFVRLWRPIKSLRQILFEDHQELLMRFDIMEQRMDKIDEISAKFDELMALLKGNIQKQIDDAKAAAVAADDAEEAGRLDALGGKIQGEIDAAKGGFTPSGNG